MRPNIKTVTAIGIFMLIAVATNSKQTKRNYVLKVEAYFYSQVIFAAAGLTCEGFEQKIDLHHTIIKDKKQINVIINELESASVGEVNPKFIDTRGKLFIFYDSGVIDTVCLNYTKYVYYRNSLVRLKSSKLIDLVYSL